MLRLQVFERQVHPHNEPTSLNLRSVSTEISAKSQRRSHCNHVIDYQGNFQRSYRDDDDNSYLQRRYQNPRPEKSAEYHSQKHYFEPVKWWKNINDSCNRLLPNAAQTQDQKKCYWVRQLDQILNKQLEEQYESFNTSQGTLQACLGRIPSQPLP